jgi:hypothetical protein
MSVLSGGWTLLCDDITKAFVTKKKRDEGGSNIAWHHLLTTIYQSRLAFLLIVQHTIQNLVTNVYCGLLSLWIISLRSKTCNLIRTFLKQIQNSWFRNKENVYWYERLQIFSTWRQNFPWDRRNILLAINKAPCGRICILIRVITFKILNFHRWLRNIALL